MNNVIKRLFMLNSENLTLTRQVQSNANLLANCTEIRNNNPRNLELLRIARKPEGYVLDNPGTGFSYWNKLIVTETNKCVEAQIYHFKNGPVIKVSSLDWCLNKFLYRPRDVAAFINIGRILVQRCLESGITQVHCNIDYNDSTKYKALLNELTNGGLILQEWSRYKHANPWDKRRQLQPWSV